MIGQQGVEFDVMRRGRARNVEGGFDRRMRCIGETPVESDVKDELEVQIDRFERGQIGESMEGLAGSPFRRVDKRDDFVDERLVQSAPRLPE